MRKVCVLLPWSISRDSRAQRTIRTMARHAEVHVVFVPLGPGDADPGMEGPPTIRLVPVRHEATRLGWLLRHSLFHLETSWLADAAAATGERYDLVYAHDLPSSYPALRLARRHRARLVYDVHDLYVETIDQGFPDEASAPKRLKYAVAKAVMRASGSAWERRFVRRADLVVTTTTSYLDYLRQRYGLADGLVLPNYPELCDVVPSGRLYGACGIPRDKSIVLYHGLLGRGRHLDLIVRSAAHFDDGNVLVLVGNGHLEQGLRELASRPEVRGKVAFLDSVPYAQLLGLASAASLGLILVEHVNLSKEYALANKLTEYMASGVPVLASDSPENRRVLAQADAGFLIRPSTAQALGARINELLRDRTTLSEKGRNGRRAFRERFHWEACEPSFERAFLGLLGAA